VPEGHTLVEELSYLEEVALASQEVAFGRQHSELVAISARELRDSEAAAAVLAGYPCGLCEGHVLANVALGIVVSNGRDQI
jgi:hypothetical protein